MVATGESGQSLDRPHAAPTHSWPNSKDGPVIQLLPLLSLDGRFAAQDLPHELQLTLLNSIVVPRIVSSSMTPTIQAADKLELSPATSLAVGSVVVFRNDSLLICQRITAIDPQGTLSTRGDAEPLRDRSARLCDRSRHGSAAQGHLRVFWTRPINVIRLGTTE